MISQRVKPLIQLIIFALSLFYCSLSLAENNANSQQGLTSKTSVLLVNPSIKNDPFWHKIENITKQAAAELDLELMIIHGQGTRYFQLEELNKFFKQNKAPDYVVLLNYPGHAQLSMDFLDKHQVKVITLEQTITQKEKSLIGEPGEIYSNWLGEIYFNNTIAGYKLAETLINTAQITHKKPVIAGVSGHFGSESGLRNNGLQAAANEKGIYLTQIVHAGWSAEDAYDKTLKLLARYPEINIFWCASDHMALGVIKALEKLNKSIGTDVFVGGFDWTSKGINSITKNKLTASIGGHFMMGAMAMMAIYKEEKNEQHDFFSTNARNSFELALINQKNVSNYIALFQGEKLKQVSFKKFVQLYSSEEALSSLDLLEILLKSSQEPSQGNIND